MLKMKIDGQLVRLWSGTYQMYESRYFYELSPGKHVVEWIASNGGVTLKDIGVENTALISVDLLEPGSLGTEILYNVDNLKDVRRLKINGSMNDDDWKIIDMMSGNLFTLDLSGTDVEVLTEYSFDSQYHGNWPFLHAVLLPNSLKSIERNAFNYTYLDSINFPISLESIGDYAFSRTNIKKALLPDLCLNLGEGVFSMCYF